MNGPPASPWAILGVAEDADEEAVRAAYLRKVREHPPDRAGDAFELVRDAYDALKDPARRAAARLTARPPFGTLPAALDAAPSPRVFVGPQPWLDVLRKAPR